MAIFLGFLNLMHHNLLQISMLIFLLDLVYVDFIQWYKLAYTTEVEIVPQNLLCDAVYFSVYLTWMNFVVKFLLPTTTLIFCNTKILMEVKKTLFESRSSDWPLFDDLSFTVSLFQFPHCNIVVSII